MNHRTIGLFNHGGESVPVSRLLAWSTGLAGFSFALGTYAGFGSAMLATWKLPLAVFLSVLITIPSLAVFTPMMGGPYSIRRSVYLAGLTTAYLGALLLALAPVMWLFASSSWFLAWPVLVAAGLGVAALGVVGYRLAGLVGKAKIGYLLWLAVLIPVTLQMVTTLRPVVTPQAPEGAGRMFFLEHFGKIADFRLPGAES